MVHSSDDFEIKRNNKKDEDQIRKDKTIRYTLHDRCRGELPSQQQTPTKPTTVSSGVLTTVNKKREEERELSSENTSLESSSTSDCSSSSIAGGTGYSEGEVLMLASRNPKKRAGRKKVNETRHPVFRGVRRRSSGKWVCEVRVPNKKARVWLGTYVTAEMAARAHDVAVLAMRGRSACLNFADSVWRLAVPESSNVQDIKRAAAEAFKPTEDAVEIVETKELEEVDVAFMDEEEIFAMPAFLASMAEGLMMQPPQRLAYGNSMDNFEFCVDDLWTF
ncbi:hypothetical protein LXL04_035297 [Taraxacum kok-saghyz]